MLNLYSFDLKKELKLINITNLTLLLCFGWIIVCRRFGIADDGITAISSGVRISSRTESLNVLAIFANSEYVHILKLITISF